MPIGIIVDCLAILTGGLIGALCGKRMPEKLKISLPMIFSVCAMTLGITLMIEVKNLAPVVLSVVLGTAIGELLNLETGLHDLTVKLQTKMQKGNAGIDEKKIEGFLTLLVLFAAGASSIFGALSEGMTGDHTFLIIKSILDFFTAMIFATTIGYMIMLISIPTFAVCITLFFLSSFIMPWISPTMAADFQACGGILTFAIGIRMMELKQVPVANTIPAILLVMPLSSLWTLLI